MRGSHPALMAAILPLLLTLALGADPAPRGEPTPLERADRVLAGERGRVIGVGDGDSITVEVGTRREKVRLLGIDTPELSDGRRPWRELAISARDFAHDHLKGRVVTLVRDDNQPDRDAYGRLLRYVVLEGRTIFNEVLVRAGLARVYRKYKFELRSRFEDAEGEARTARRGIWSLPPGPFRSKPY